MWSLSKINSVTTKQDGTTKSTKKSISFEDNKVSNTITDCSGCSSGKTETYPQTLKEIFCISNNNRKKNK